MHWAKLFMVCFLAPPVCCDSSGNEVYEEASEEEGNFENGGSVP
jgi:hypothetical protein